MLFYGAMATEMKSSYDSVNIFIGSGGPGTGYGEYLVSLNILCMLETFSCAIYIYPVLS